MSARTPRFHGLKRSGLSRGIRELLRESSHAAVLLRREPVLRLHRAFRARLDPSSMRQSHCLPRLARPPLLFQDRLLRRW